MFIIASTTTQTKTPQLPHASRNTNPHMSKSSGVIHSTSVSRPQRYQVKDKVVPNNSHVKFQKKEVEDHHRISSISKKTKSLVSLAIKDGENLDKMIEKGDPCVMVGYSTQSKGYRVYNKRTRFTTKYRCTATLSQP
ncbi:hypothetical protein Tco_0224356 [Tanacetum coccineum]